MLDFEAGNPIIVTQYKWAGQWGMFRIQSHCGECDLVTSILRNVMERELKDKHAVFEVKPWLGNALFCLSRGVWHPPIIMINGRKFFQYTHKKPMFDRLSLVKAVEEIIAEQSRLRERSRGAGA